MRMVIFEFVIFCTENPAEKKKAVGTAANRGAAAAAERSDVAPAGWGVCQGCKGASSVLKNPEAVRPDWLHQHHHLHVPDAGGPPTDSHLGFCARRHAAASTLPQTYQPHLFTVFTSCWFYPTVNAENTSEPLSHPGSHPLRTPDEPIAAPRACVAHIQQIDTN